MVSHGCNKITHPRLRDYCPNLHHSHASHNVMHTKNHECCLESRVVDATYSWTDSKDHVNLSKKLDTLSTPIQQTVILCRTIFMGFDATDLHYYWDHEMMCGRQLVSYMRHNNIMCNITCKTRPITKLNVYNQLNL